MLDFEATCWDDDGKSRNKMEVIEFPSIIIKWNLKTGESERIGEFQRYCKPKSFPQLSKFCTELTGITQETVNKGVTFSQALKEHEAWMAKTIPNFYYEENVYIMTCGRWDIDIQLPRDLKNWNIHSVNRVYKRFINLKSEFQYFLKEKRGRGLANMLKFMNLKLEGKHHSGIDDCRNQTKILEELIKCGMKGNDMKIEYVSKKKYGKKNNNYQKRNF
jgi:inhibitor of KinA sporulation pathway (predicted exonuclease)